MKQFLFILISLFFINPLLSQTNRHYETNPDRKRTFNWLFGNKIWLDYKTNPPQHKSGSQLNAAEPISVYSDTSGALVLYTNGLTIWSGNHNVILNGTGLNGDNSSSQGALFVRHPSIDSIVYLFTTDLQCGPKGLQVSTISINPNIDSSRVIDKNRLLITPVCESISATQHQNGKYSWVTVHSKLGNTFYSYLVSDQGISECPVISSQGYNYDGHIFNCQTISEFSDDGKYFAITVLNDYKVIFLSFDNLTGQFELQNLFDNVVIPSGLAFSNNGNLLYMVERTKQISQINLKTLQNNFIPKTFIIIQVEKTPYGEIFVNVFDSFYASSIKHPDSVGTKSSFVLRNIYLNGTKGKTGLPNFNQSYFYTPSIDFVYKYNCLDNSISFEGRDTFNADSFNWKAKKVYGNTNYSSILKKPLISFIDTGLYEVIFIATKGSRSDTVAKRIHIYPKISKDFLGSDTLYKSDVPFSLLLKSPPSMHCIRWQDSSSSPTFTANTTGVYFVSVTNKAFCTFNDTITVTKCINSLPQPSIFRFSDTLRTGSSIADSLIWFKDDKLLYITTDTFILLTDTGKYRVEAAKQGYCNNSSKSISYSCLDNLIQPSIFLSRDTLYTYQPQADSFVWYRNGQKLITTKEAFIKLSDTGTYRVEAIKKIHCNRSSSNFQVSKLDVGMQKLSSSNVRIYPNPVDESVTIETQGDESFILRLYDSEGRLIYEKTGEGTKITLNIGSYTQGLYLIELINYQTFYHYKILKQ